jgi:hypothetical protein
MKKHQAPPTTNNPSPWLCPGGSLTGGKIHLMSVAHGRDPALFGSLVR